jgi:chemotaxis family two-component system sensor kinase Cph1
MASDPAAPPIGPIDLTDCAREPIHVPGSIQTFGVLLAMRAGEQIVSQASSNTELVFGVPPEDLLGRKLSEAVGELTSARIAEVLAAGTWKEANALRISITRSGSALEANVIVHRYDGLDFVEIEPVSSEGAEAAKRSYNLVQGALIRLQKSVNIPDLWSTVVAEVQRITGFDRVMVYQFDRDDHGYVIAEQKREHQQSFLGLHYPASDIPDQARRLYRMNWVRYIPDIHYKPVDVVPVVDEDHHRLTDMTHCVLRSVSPVHCEYLHNMGVAASMSVSILRENRLWGLIACHNDTPRYLPYELRAACELLGHVLSIRIAALEETDDNAYRARTNALQARFLADLPRYRDAASALVSNTPNLMEFIPSTGAAVCFGGRISVLGRAPSETQIQTILHNTLSRVKAPIFVTDRLQDRMIEGRDLTDTASGVLCFTVSRVHNFHVFWFRTEQVQVVNWSGEPTKPVHFDGTELRLSPRRSFEVWKQEVRGKSQVWLQTEIEAAAELRSTLMSLLLANSAEGQPAE